MQRGPRAVDPYGKRTYWDERFTREGAHAQVDWYAKFPQLRPELGRWVNKSDAILVIGCGNSRLSEDLYANEYKNVTSVDWSGVVIKQMRERTAGDKPELVWKTMDVTEKLDFPDDSFQVVVDKGCLDTILCGENSTNAVFATLLHVYRVCSGVFILISNWGPEKWMGFLDVDVLSWTIQAIPVPTLRDTGVDYWIFVMDKKTQ